MVRGLTGDRLVPPRPAAPAYEVVLPRELPGGLDRLRAARDEEDAVQVARRERRELRGELDGARMRVRPVRVEGQLAHLRERGLADLLAERVADVDREEPGERVEVPLAVRILEVAPLAADDHRHVLVAVAAHAREVHPQVVLREPAGTRVRRNSGSPCRPYANRPGVAGGAVSRTDRRATRSILIGHEHRPARRLHVPHRGHPWLLAVHGRVRGRVRSRSTTEVRRDRHRERRAARRQGRRGPRRRGALRLHVGAPGDPVRRRPAVAVRRGGGPRPRPSAPGRGSASTPASRWRSRTGASAAPR